jgi:hypothetical protein
VGVKIACNHLLNFRKSRLELSELTFGSFAEDLADGLSDDSVGRPDDLVLLQEIRIGCTLGMLLCLDRAHRIAYIVGEILEFDSNEAATVLDITSQAFRKRLERARAKIVAFMKMKCGLVNPQNSCRCHKRLPRALETCRVHVEHLLFAGDGRDAANFPNLLSTIRHLEDVQRAVAVYRTHPDYRSPTDFTDAVKRLLLNKRLPAD